MRIKKLNENELSTSTYYAISDVAIYSSKDNYRSLQSYDEIQSLRSTDDLTKELKSQSKDLIQYYNGTSKDDLISIVPTEIISTGSSLLLQTVISTKTELSSSLESQLKSFLLNQYHTGWGLNVFTDSIPDGTDDDDDYRLSLWDPLSSIAIQSDPNSR